MRFRINRKILILSVLFWAGFFLRFAGLFFMGNAGNYAKYQEWGYGIRTKGLAETFNGGYGPIAYIIFGLADYIGSFTPSVWWWSYKGANLFFELLILVFFFRRFPKERLKIMLLYWLNPWFLIPSAWQGFWDASFAFFMFLTAIYLDKCKENKTTNYFLPGFLLGISAMVKPQIIAPLSALGLVFAFYYLIRKRLKELFSFSLGAALLPFLFNAYFLLYAKGMLFLVKEYSGFVFYMPYLVASEINIWHTVTRIIMYIKHMEGPIYSLSTLEFPYNLMEKGAYLAYFLLIFAFLWKNNFGKTRDYFLKIITFSFILMPQILTRSHAYHWYPASLFLVFLIIKLKNKKLLFFWLIGVISHFYGIWWHYGLGDQIGHYLRPPEEPHLSVMGIVSFISTIGIVRIFFERKNHIDNNFLL